MRNERVSFSENSLKILAFLIENNLTKFAKSKELLRANKEQRKRYLNALAKMSKDTKVLRTVLKGKGSRNQIIALRKFIKFLLSEGLIQTEAGLELLSRLKVPRTKAKLEFYSDEDIIKLLKSVRGKKSRLLFMLAIESGLRRSHLVEAFNKLTRGEFERHGDIVIVFLGKESATKKAYICMCSAKLAEEIRHSSRVSINTAARLTKEHGIEWNKVRKWHATTLLSLEVPGEVVDFLQGRSPRSVLAQHYLNTLTLAKKYYPRLLAYLEKNIYPHL